jgi:hypothetical protein
VHVNDRKVSRCKSDFLKIFSPRAEKKLSAKNFFAESHREFLSSARIFFTHGEEFFAESPRGGSRQRLLLSAKDLSAVVCAPLPRRNPKHNILALRLSSVLWSRWSHVEGVLGSVARCHTRFYKENRMHLTCAPGSFYTHMIEKTRVIPLQ